MSSADPAGKPYILTFWASWCGPCRLEMPVLSEMQERYRDRGLVVVGVNVDREPARAEAFLKSVGADFPIAWDPDSRLMERFATRGTPTTFWVTRSGTIRQRTVGYDDRGTATMDANVEALLAAE